MIYARVTLLEIDTVRATIDDAVATFEADVLPRLHEQPGFRGVQVLTNPAGRGLIMSLWDTPEAADAGESGFYGEMLAAHATLFRSPPGRERYEVRLTDPPNGA